MAVTHHTLTLSGSAQALSAASNTPPTASVRTVTIQPDTANVGAIRVGGSGVSAADYGIYIPAPASATAPPAPLIFGETQSIHGHFKLSEVFVIGTSTEKVRLTVVTI